MRDVHLYYQRTTRNFRVVRSSGVMVADGVATIEDGWKICDAEQQAIDDRCSMIRAQQTLYATRRRLARATM
jgi:hypothetical protein